MQGFVYQRTNPKPSGAASFAGDVDFCNEDLVEDKDVLGGCP